MGASVPFEDVFKEVTHTDTEEQQYPSDEESLSQLSTVSQNAATWGKISHLLNKVWKDI